MLIQKKLFIWQTILVILFLAITYIYSDTVFLAGILFAPLEVLYLMRLGKRKNLIELNKIFRIICYILLIPTLYHILLFLCVHAENFWWELFYIDVDRFFWFYGWMLHSFSYPVRYLLLALLLLEMILINKKMPKE